MQGLCGADKKMGAAGKAAVISSLKELIAQMQGQMVAGEGDKEMSGDTLSEAIESATEGAKHEGMEMEGKEMPGEEAMSMQEDMKRMLNGPKAKPSRAKMSVAIQVKKPGKKFGKA